jgi:DNA-binding LacI/PurR family transcriptional regulator
MVTPSRGPSLASVARALNLSATTVSNAYNRPEKLSAALRDRILEHARLVGYVGPNPVARQLSRGRTDTIGLVFVDELRYALHRALVAFIEGLADVCERTDRGLLVIPTGIGQDDRRIGKISSAAVDGLVVYSPPDRDPRLSAALARHVPVAVVEGPRSGRASWVGLDDEAATAALARHLLELGHRHVGVVSLRLHVDRTTGFVGEDRWTTASYRVPRERIRGIFATVGASGVPSSVSVYECAESSIAAGARAAADLLTAHPEITAVMALDDVLALGVLREAGARGRRVPDDLSVTGFDDVAEASWRGLTTIRQPIHEKGRVAGQLLVSRLAGATLVDETVVLPAELVVRASTGPVPRH